MINDSFGFDAGEEVIVGVGERLARILARQRHYRPHRRQQVRRHPEELQRARDRCRRGRLRAAVREHGIETRGGQVAATCSVGAVWLPGAASNSQEAMLRAEQALDKARANGRDGFAVYEHSPQRETGAAAPDGASPTRSWRR